jgi:ankyrin repeat protein
MAKHIQSILETRVSEEGYDIGFVVPFYCDNSFVSGNDPPIFDHLIRSVLKRRKLSNQLKQRLQRILEAETLGTQTKLPYNSLIEVAQLLFIQEDSSVTYLLVDGLDQCSDSFVYSLLSGLNSIICSDQQNFGFKVVITSRNNDAVESFKYRHLHIEMSPAKIQRDIEHVVESQINEICTTRRIMGIDKAFVKRSIVDLSHGSFLFTSSLLREISRTQKAEANFIYNLLFQCPSNMQDMYRQDMKRLQAQRTDLFVLVQLVAVACRPLDRAELWDILYQENEHLNHDYDIFGELKVLCPHLITIYSQGTVGLVHRTLYDLIYSAYDVEEIHGVFVRTCLKYFKTQNFGTQKPGTNHPDVMQKSSEAIFMTKFLDYALRYLPFHLIHSGKHAASVAHEIWDLLCSKSGLVWQQGLGAVQDGVYHGQSHSISSKNDHSSTLGTPFLVLASWDAAEVIKVILAEHVEPSPQPFMSQVHEMISAYISTKATSESSTIDGYINEKVQGASAAHFAAGRSGRALDVLLPFIDDIDLIDDNGSTPLHWASASGSLKSVCLLLKEGAQVDIVNIRGDTALHKAVRLGHTRIVQTLLEHGANPNTYCAAGKYPLEVTVERNDIETAKCLLQYGANAKLQTSDGISLGFLALSTGSLSVLEELLPYIELEEHIVGMGFIQFAACRGHEGIVRKLISLGVSPDKIYTTCPMPATMIALISGQEGTFGVMMDAGANSRVSLPMGMTLLHIAVRKESTKACESLLRHGCDIDALNCYHNSALGYAIEQEHQEIVDLLLQYGADPDLCCGSEDSLFDTPLILAGSSEKMTRILLRAGVSAIPKSALQRSSFHLACAEGSLEVIEAFLDEVEPSQLLHLEWGWQRTPLHEAATSGKVDTFKLLLRQGIILSREVDRKLIGGRHLLHAAAKGGNLEIFQLVLDSMKCPKIEINDDDGATPLYYASLHGRDSMVEFLIRNGAQTHFICKGVNLLTASAKGSTKVVENLLKVTAPSDLDVLNRDGSSPLMLAARYRRAKTVTALLNCGVDINQQSADGRSALSIAIYHNKKSVLKALLCRDDIDLLQKDAFGQNSLQMARTAGHDGFPAMILTAAKTTKVEDALLLNKDMFGLTATDYLSTENILSEWNLSLFIKGIHDSVSALLQDLAGLGLLWEKLGKYLL